MFLDGSVKKNETSRRLNSRDFLATHPLLSDRVRLSIMGILVSAGEPVQFSELIEALDLSKGNLSAHMSKLEAEKLIIVNKEFVDKKPRTTYEFTDLGRKALSDYLEQVQKMLLATSTKGKK